MPTKNVFAILPTYSHPLQNTIQSPKIASLGLIHLLDDRIFLFLMSVIILSTVVFAAIANIYDAVSS